MLTPVIHPWFQRLQQQQQQGNTKQSMPFTSELLNQEVRTYDPALRQQLLRIPPTERRKLEESVRKSHMHYDPFWCCWRPSVPRQEFAKLILKMAQEQGIQLAAEEATTTQKKRKKKKKPTKEEALSTERETEDFTEEETLKRDRTRKKRTEKRSRHQEHQKRRKIFDSEDDFEDDFQIEKRKKRKKNKKKKIQE